MSDIVIDTPASATTIDAELNYLEFNGERPVSYQYEPPPGVLKRSGVYRAYRVPISNARVAPPPGALSVDRNGFELHRQPSALRDFSDPEQIKSVYYPEAEALLKRATGAKRAVVFDHTLRDGKLERPDGVREPVKYIHNDQTFVSGPRRVRDHLPKGGRPHISARRARAPQYRTALAAVLLKQAVFGKRHAGNQSATCAQASA